MKPLVPSVVCLSAAVIILYGQQSSTIRVNPRDPGSQQKVLPPDDGQVRVGVVEPPDASRLENSKKSGSAKDTQTAPGGQAISNYLLGPGDQVSFIVGDLDDFSDQTFTIDMHGDLNLPLAGRFHVAGLTLDQLEQQTRDRLKKYVKTPDVVASIAEFHSQSISVIGAVNNPGVHQLQGHKTLFEVLSLSGGLRTDAGSTINITRNLRWGRIPLADAKDDASAHFSIASVKVKSTMDASDPSQNIVIMPDDVISVPKGQIVYAVGSVIRPGGFLLGEQESLSSLQVVSLAEGLDKVAAADKARILRSVPGSPNRAEIPINLKELMAGKAPDVPLKADDILFVPSSRAKSISKRSLDAVIQVATGVAIYGRY